MDKEQRIAEIKNQLRKVANATRYTLKSSVNDLLRLLGVDERIINNPNPYSFEAYNFIPFLKSLEFAEVMINDDGSMNLKTTTGSVDLMSEANKIYGVETYLTVKDGNICLSTQYKRDNYLGFSYNYEIGVANYGKEQVVKVKDSVYCLQPSYDDKGNYNTNKIVGFGTCRMSQYDENGIEINCNKISYSNSPQLSVGSDGLRLSDIASQRYYLENDVIGWARKPNDPLNGFSIANKDSAYFVSETFAHRMAESIGNVEMATWRKNSPSWDRKYVFNSTGEHHMGMLFNNASSYSTKDELEAARRKAWENGYFDYLIKEYRKKSDVCSLALVSKIEEEVLKLEKEAEEKEKAL